MKKILFALILATTFIPVPQTGATIGDMDVSDKLKTKEIQIVPNQVSNNVSDQEVQMTQGKILNEEISEKSYIRKQRLTKKSISSEKRDRLFGLLLLAHGGQR